MARTRYADLILTNARVLTMERQKPQAWFVAVAGGKIAGTAGIEEAQGFKGPHTREIDCRGMTLVPGFNDAHCHLMSLASSLRSIDCRPDRASSIPQIVEAIKQRAEETPEGSWIKGFGYEEFYLAERRHPTRWDLDRAAPLHPVRLDHRTGHASVLNSRGLDLLGISRYAPDPPDGVVERDTAEGEPTGVLFEMSGYLRRGMGRGGTTPLSENELLDGVKKANCLLLSSGITAIQDASPGNDLDRWETFRKLKDRGHLTPRVTVMIGAPHMSSFLHGGLTPDGDGEGLRLGAVKVMLSLTTGALHPHREELKRIILEAQKQRLQLAFHAVEEEAVEAAADVLLYAQEHVPVRDARHRIEHCSECPPRVLQKLKRCRAVVVTQPSFIYHNAEKYLALVDQELLPYLYPIGSLDRAGIPVAAGSDAPVTHPDPLLGMYCAVTRKSKGGASLYPSQAVPAETALRMHTLNAAYASFEEGKRGSIAPGKLADLALLDRDPTAVEPKEIKDIKVTMTMVGGELVWER